MKAFPIINFVMVLNLLQARHGTGHGGKVTTPTSSTGTATTHSGTTGTAAATTHTGTNGTTAQPTTSGTTAQPTPAPSEYLWKFEGDTQGGISINRRHGNIQSTQAPLGTGIYLNGSNNTWADLGDFENTCLMEPASTSCDNITVSVFLKLIPKETQDKHILFGNMPNGTNQGITVYYTSKPTKYYTVAVYGSDRFCLQQFDAPTGIWFYLAFVWSKQSHALKVYVNSKYIGENLKTCMEEPEFVTQKKYTLGQDSFPKAYYDNLHIRFLNATPDLRLNAAWNEVIDNGGSTTVTLDLHFTALSFNTSNAETLKTQLQHLFRSDSNYINSTVEPFSRHGNSDNYTAIIILVFRTLTPLHFLSLQIALENRRLLGTACSITKCNADDNFFCKTITTGLRATAGSPSTINVYFNEMAGVSSTGYHAGYYVLYKNTDNSTSTWQTTQHRGNEETLTVSIKGLSAYSNYTVRVMANSFKAMGLVSKAIFGRTAMSVPNMAPHIVFAYNYNSTRIYLEWTHSIPPKNYRGVLIGYCATRQNDGGNTTTDNVGLLTKNYVFNDLQNYKFYTVSVSGRTKEGCGTYARREVRTSEGVPSHAPCCTSLEPSNDTSLVLSWGNISDVDSHNGIILGYHLQLYDGNSNTSLQEVNVSETTRRHEFSGLLKYYLYMTQVAAFTVKGTGVPAILISRTLESVPVVSPFNITGSNTSSMSIRLRWVFINTERHVLGQLTGFTIYYKPANASDVFLANESTLVVHGNPNSRGVEVNNLRIYTLYRINMAAMTSKGSGVLSSEVVEIRTNGRAPARKPLLTGHSNSSTSIRLQWDPVPKQFHNGPLLGYKAFLYLRGNSQTSNFTNEVKNQVFPITQRNVEFTGLLIFTNYLAKVCAYNEYGDGIKGAGVEIQTESSPPSRPPTNVKAVNTSSTAILVTWEPLNDSYYLHGTLLGYNLLYSRADGQGNEVLKTVPPGGSYLTDNLINLPKYTEYRIRVLAYNVKGNGTYDEVVCSTDQDVPSAPPQRVSGHNISKNAIKLSWEAIPSANHHGVILGYSVDYRLKTGAARWRRRDVCGSSNKSAINIKDLTPYTNYELKTVAFTIKGHGRWSPGIFIMTGEDAPKSTPGNFSGVNISSTTIQLYWSLIPASQVAGILRQYRILYQNLNINDNVTRILEVPADKGEAQLTNLDKYTKYSFQIQGFTNSYGALTTKIVIVTDEDVPSLPQQNITPQVESSTSITISWNPIPKQSMNGILRGYKILFKSAPKDNSIVPRPRERRSITGVAPLDKYNVTILPPTATSVSLTGLKKYTNYTILVLGFTSKGDGNVSQELSISTGQDVPSKPPVNMVHANRSGAYSIPVRWSPVPLGYVHGILLGYRIYYQKVKYKGVKVTGDTRSKTVGPDVWQTVLKPLTKNSAYKIQLTAFTVKGEGPRTDASISETCRCPPIFTTTWYNFPPYVHYTNGQLKGFLPQILKDAITECCSDCVNGFGVSSIDFKRDGQGKRSEKKNVADLVASINSHTDIAFPMYGYKGQTMYSSFRYVPIASSPGVAYITVMDTPTSTSSVVQSAIKELWPMCVLFLVLTTTFGMVLWLLEMKNNSTHFPQSFIYGVPNGIWLAFITMTTLGYGDRVAQSFKGRILTIAWTLIGLVLTAILTGQLATAFTTYTVEGGNAKLYGIQVAAIANQSEVRLGLRKNARMNIDKNYSTYEEIRDALLSRKVKGALIDMYVLSSNKNLFEHPSLRIVRLYDYKANYGAVLTERVMDLKECFLDHVKVQRVMVFKAIVESVKVFKEPKGSIAETRSTGLFSASTAVFLLTVSVLSGILGVAIFACSLVEMRRIGKTSYIDGKLGTAQFRQEMRSVVVTFYEDFKLRLDKLAKRHQKQRHIILKQLTSSTGDSTILINRNSKRTARKCQESVETVECGLQKTENTYASVKYERSKKTAKSVEYVQNEDTKIMSDARFSRKTSLKFKGSLAYWNGQEYVRENRSNSGADEMELRAWRPIFERREGFVNAMDTYLY